MAPEQAAGESDVGATADIYAAGAILYFLVTRKPPHQADSLAALIAAKLEKDPANPSSIQKDVPQAFDQIVLRALAIEPQDRFQSASEMRKNLLHWLETGTLHPSMDTFASLDGALADSLVALDEVGNQPAVALKPIATGPQLPDPTAGRERSLTPATATGGSGRRNSSPKNRLDSGRVRINSPAKTAAASPVATLAPLEEQKPLELAVIDDKPLELAEVPRSRPRVQTPVARGRGARVRKGGGTMRTLLLGVLLGAVGFAAYQYYQGGLSFDSKGGQQNVSVRFLTTPAHAEVLVDGVKIVGSELQLPKSTRPYEAVVRASGFDQQRTTFVPETNLVLRIDLRRSRGKTRAIGKKNNKRPSKKPKKPKKRSPKKRRKPKTKKNP
jgi:hypothetical protein